MVLKSRLENLVQSTANKFGLTIIRSASYARLQSSEADTRVLAIARRYPNMQREVLTFAEQSISQLNQDLLALAENSFQTNGYFVEFGAADGKDHSNSLFLEYAFGWSGLLVEPVRRQFIECTANRKALTVHGAVSGRSGEKLTLEDRGLFTKTKNTSTFKAKMNPLLETVESVSLDELLQTHAQKRCINFLSIDTEGSELDILENFSFDYCIHFAAIEHNFSHDRVGIASVMSKQGFEEVLKDVSKFDSWWSKPCKSKS